MLACQEESGPSSEACLFCCADSIGMEDLHFQKEADPLEAGSHHSSSPLQRTVGSKEVCHHVGEAQRRKGEEKKGGRVVEKEKGARKTRSTEKRKLVVLLYW